MFLLALEVDFRVHSLPHFVKLPFRLLLLGLQLPHVGFKLARHNRHDRGVDVRRVLVHVQHCRNGVLPAECAVQPLQVVIAPFAKPAIVLHSHHVFVRTRKHDADCPHLAWRYLSPDARRADAVVYHLGAVCLS